MAKANTVNRFRVSKIGEEGGKMLKESLPKSIVDCSFSQ